MHYAYQSEEWPHVTPMNFNLWFVCNCRREKFMAIVDLLVAVISHSHFHCLQTTVHNVSDHSSNHKWVCWYPGHLDCFFKNSEETKNKFERLNVSE